MKFQKIAAVLTSAAMLFGGLGFVPAVPTAPVILEADALSVSDYADQVTALVNQERANYGLSPVYAAPSLYQAAQTRANELAVSYSHIRPDGSDPDTVLPESAAKYSSYAENIARYQKTPEAVVSAWMNSDGHRKNILNANMKYIGVGVKEASTGYYWVQEFVGGVTLENGYLPAVITDTEPETTPVSSGSVHVAIDQKELTLDELKNLNYQVPVFVRLNENPGINAMEFGFEVDSRCSYEIVDTTKTSENLTGESLKYFPEFSSNGSLTWTAWAKSEPISITGNYLLILVNIPETVSGGEKFDITYRTDGYNNAGKAKTHFYRDTLNQISYTDISWTDGYIKIAEPDEPAPAGGTERFTLSNLNMKKGDVLRLGLSGDANDTVQVHFYYTDLSGTNVADISAFMLSSAGKRTISFTAPYEVDSLTIKIVYEQSEPSYTYSVEYNYIETTTTTQAETTTTSTTTTSTTTAATTTSTAQTTTATRTQELTLTKTSVSLNVGEQFPIEANQSNLTYKSSNTDVAIVSKKGVITALQEGTAVITVYNADYDAVTLKVTVSAEPVLESGDLNGDSSIDIMDVIMINKAIFGKTDLTAAQIKAADLNGNGSPDSTDALIIMKFIIKLTNTLSA